MLTCEAIDERNIVLAQCGFGIDRDRYGAIPRWASGSRSGLGRVKDATASVGMSLNTPTSLGLGVGRGAGMKTATALIIDGL
ncbi:hypothetical protein AB0M35_28030 [Micromonospora sp. NPDC051196]|uniref:hypothetical protein n=1 Tax=Micromonospora sp. NPDC051196 TaxID=3155281 RepID=UPI0034133BC9